MIATIGSGKRRVGHKTLIPMPTCNIKVRSLASFAESVLCSGFREDCSVLNPPAMLIAVKSPSSKSCFFFCYICASYANKGHEGFPKACVFTKRLITSNLLSDRLRSGGETKFPSAMGWTKLWHGAERQGGTDLTPTGTRLQVYILVCRTGHNSWNK